MISAADMTAIRVCGSLEEPHGTRHRYLGGCRCVPCRAANSRYSCERAAAQRAGDWRGFVPAALVLGHIQQLRKGGIGYKAIAAAAGLAKSTLAMILTGKRLLIRRHHAIRILRVNRSAVVDCAVVPAGPTWRLLNELREAGYTKTFLAKQLRSRAKRRSLQIEARWITALTASKVERLYRRIREGRGGCPAHRRTGAKDRPAHHGKRLFKKPLQHFREHHPPAVVNGGDVSLKKSSKPRLQHPERDLQNPTSWDVFQAAVRHRLAPL